MKLNIFNVKEKKENRIILEEEHTKNKFFLFFLKIRKFLFLFLICILLVIVGLSFSLFRGSNDYDITYIVGDENIITNNDPSVDEEDIKDELLGEIAREEGVVILVRTVMTSAGDVISYFTDKSAIVVKSNGKIYRVSSNDKENYGINDRGKVEDTAIKILVTSITSTLSDGTIITNYSDGTAKVELNGNAIFVRDSNNIELFNGSSFDKTKPSGVALSKKINRVNGYYVNEFTDRTTLIEHEGKKYIVNKNIVPSINGNNVNVDWNNAFVSISEQKYGDYTINHYVNGSATVTDKKGNVFFVRKSGDLVLKKKEKKKELELYEIIPNEKGESIKAILTTNRTNVIYYSNGVSVVVNSNGNRYYLEDADEIIYDGNKNINDNYNKVNLLEQRTTKDGESSYNFANGKSQVIRKDGSSYIVDTDTLEFKPVEDTEVPDVKPELPGTTPEPINPEEWFDVSKAINEYVNVAKNIENTKFFISNKTRKSKKIIITIQEAADYRKYDLGRLPPKFVKFQTTITPEKGETKYIEGKLTDKTWVTEEGITNYVIYEGTINAKDVSTVNLVLKVDYKDLNNTYQNKAFIGTINIYVDE